MPEHEHDRKKEFDENWYWYLTGENRAGFDAPYGVTLRRFRQAAGWVPGRPRCFECNRPLSGFGSWLTRAQPSTFSPRLCNSCEKYIRREEGGTEVELSLLFADVRGSTVLAEKSSPAEFNRIIQRFYQATSQVLIEHNAMVNRLMGDQVIGLFVPRFAGSDHAQAAIATALDMMRATGHGDPAGPWIPIGIGINTGETWVGAVGTKGGVNEIAVLGSTPNLAARLSAQAADGEVLVSQASAESAKLATGGLENRQLNLKGFGEQMSAWVLRSG